jgi:hypothetical protein
VSALVIAAVAVAGLSGCRTNVGTAATVNGSKISESDVGKYITAEGVDPSLAAQANGQVKSPRSQVLEFLIQQRVFERTLDTIGGVPSDTALSASHDEAASVLSQTQLSGAAFDTEIGRELVRAGVKSDFLRVFLRVQELEYAIIKRRSLTQLSELLTLIRKAGVTVSVSPRYGKWDANTLSLDGKPAVPSYLSVQPTPNAAAQAQPVG